MSATQLQPRLHLVILPFALVSLIAACDTPTPTKAKETHQPATTYVPQPVWCADGSGALCPVIPSFIGPDPAIQKNNGYQGLSNDVTSARFDAQTPFDNMSWQMFIALNWQASQSGGDPKTAL
jgi:hypothetical protein